MKEINMIFCLLLCTNLCASASMKFPEDSGVIDVTKPPYDAIGDGKTDDTEAIQKALSQYPSGNRIIYLPEGIYLVSDTLKWPKGKHGGEDHKRTILEGDGLDKSIIRLMDNCPGYTDVQNPKSVIWTGEKPAQRFRNAIKLKRRWECLRKFDRSGSLKSRNMQNLSTYHIPMAGNCSRVPC